MSQTFIFIKLCLISTLILKKSFGLSDTLYYIPVYFRAFHSHQHILSTYVILRKLLLKSLQIAHVKKYFSLRQLSVLPDRIHALDSRELVDLFSFLPRHVSDEN